MTLGRGLTRGLALLLVAALPTAAWAECLPTAPANEQMACCLGPQGEHHDCGSAMAPADCCRTIKPTTAAFVVAKPVVTRVATPLAIVATFTSLSDAVGFAGARRHLPILGSPPVSPPVRSVLRI